MNSIEMIRKLTDAFGPSGFEEDVNEVVKEIVGKEQVSFDALKNCYIGLDETDEDKETILLDAHTDELGFIVRSIDKDGLLSFLPLGGWVTSTVSAQMVWVRGENKTVPGLIGARPIHFLSKEEADKKLEWENLKIDLGGYTRDQVINDLGIRVGSPIVPRTDFEFNEETGFIRAKALDNRIGTAAVIETFNALSGKSLSYNVVGGLATQEEVGGRGAKVTARVVKPKYAFVFEGSPADDLYTDEYTMQCKINGGPQIRHYDGSYISDTHLIKLAEEVSKEKNIPIQHAVRKGSGTNAGILHQSNEGIACIVIGIPSRYVHSHYSYASIHDFNHAVQLAVAMIEKLRG